MRLSRRNIPLLYFPVIILSGMACGIALLIWFRMFANLFGFHQFSLSSILIVLLIFLAAGSRLGGWLADKHTNRIMLFAACQFTLGIFTLFNPLVFEWLQKILSLLLMKNSPSAFSMGIIRIGLIFIFLSIPIISMGMILPVLSRHFTVHAGHRGNQLSAVLSLTLAGLAAGFMLAGFILIPRAGMNSTLQFSSLISLLVASFMLFLILRKKTAIVSGSHVPQASRVKHTGMLFRKSKTVLETGARLTRAMLRVHAVNGFAGASFLVIAFRILADYSFIGHIYIQLLILATYFVGISTGNALYKVFTNKTVNGYLLMASLEILTSFAILFSIVLVAITGPLMLRYNLNAVPWSKTILYQLLPVLSLVLLPAIITGFLLPLSGRIYPKRLQHTGRYMGKLNALFYSGAIWGILMSHYLLMPLVGSLYSCFILILVFLLSGFYLLYKDSRLIRGFRLSYTAITLAFITGILFFLLKSGWINAASTLKTEPVKEVQEGSSSRVRLYDKGLHRQSVSINGIENFESGKEGLQDQQLPACISCIIGDTMKTSLVIGFGMGLTSSALDECNIPHIQIAEIFPEVLTLSSRFFYDLNNDILTSSHADVTIEDARIYLSRTSNTFDLITSGYTDIHLVPGYFTSEFFQICYKSLSEKGLLAQVLPLHGINVAQFKSVIRSCGEIFPALSLWYISRDQVLLIAGRQARAPDYCIMAGKYTSLNQNKKMENLGISGVEDILARRMMDNSQLTGWVKDAPENSDDNPFIEFSKNRIIFTDQDLCRQLSGKMDASQFFADSPFPCTGDQEEIRNRINRMKESIKQELLSIQAVH